MRCKVCQSEIDKGIAKCSKCGFPVLQMTQGTAAEEEKMNKLAESYKSKKMENVRISLIVYTNAMDTDRAKVVREDEILLASGSSLNVGKICWYPEKFARQSGHCQLNLKIVTSNGAVKNIKVPLKNPNIMDFWKVGIYPMEGMEFKVVLGNETSYSCSDKFSFL